MRRSVPGFLVISNRGLPAATTLTSPLSLTIFSWQNRDRDGFANPWNSEPDIGHDRSLERRSGGDDP